jgi:isopenicillin-N epimerase
VPTRHASRFALDPDIVFLNHGSFGACPRSVLEEQTRLRAEMEREPVRFHLERGPKLIDEARQELASFLSTRPERLAFVRNASEGVNAVLRSRLPTFRPGERVLTTDHAYNSCRVALDDLASRAGLVVDVAHVPFPLERPEQMLDAVMEHVTPTTRLALLDHVTSPTGLVLPALTLADTLEERGVEVLIDGAHAPGMLPLDLGASRASYYVGNLHKWLYCPKGTGILHARDDRADSIEPLVLTYNSRLERGRPRLWERFDWAGTADVTGWMCVPAALRELQVLSDGDPEALRRELRARALEYRDRLCEALGVAHPAPDSMIATLVSVPLPDGAPSTPGQDSLTRALYDRHRIEIPVFPWPSAQGRVLRFSVAPYVGAEDLDALLVALAREGVTHSSRTS